MNTALDDKTPLIHRFRSRVESNPSDIAFRYKSLGIWHSVPWNRYGESVRNLAVTFEDWGIGAGSTVMAVADTRPEVLIADMAAQSVGATLVILPANTSDQRCVELVDEIRPSLVVVENQDDAARLLEHDVGGLDRVLVIGERTRRVPSDPRVIPFETTTIDRPDAAARWETQLAARHPDEAVATVLTRGADGGARSIALSSLNVGHAWVSSFGSALQFDRPQRSIACVPLSFPAARCLTMYFPLFHDDVPHLPEQLRLVGQAVTDVEPTIVLHRPEFWERLVAELDAATYSGPLSKMLYRRMLKDSGTERRTLAGRLFGSAIRRRIGFSRLELALSAGWRGVDPITRGRMGALGVEFAELYQVAEAAGFAGLRRARSGSAGYHISDAVETRVGDDGSALLQGPQIASAVVAAGPEPAPDGWIATDDIVEVVADGELVILGRAEDLVTGPDGRRCSVSDVERALERSPLIHRASVVQLDGGRLGALVEFHDGRLSSALAESGLRLDGYANLVASDDAMARMAAEMERANEWLSTMSLILVESFEILPAPFGGSPGVADADRRADRARRCEAHANLVERLRSDAGRRSAVGDSVGAASVSGGTE